jgi:tetratricopeptide (TPR) repeat protein
MRKAIFLMVLIGSAFCLSCSSFGIMSEEDAYLSAMDSYNKKDFEKARTLLSEFYENYKGSKYRPNVMLKLAELEQDFFKSEAMYKDVIKYKPDTEFEAEAVFSLARLYYARNEYTKSVEYAGIIMGRFGNTMWIEPAYHYIMLALNAQKKYGETARYYAEYNSNSNYFMFKNRIKLAYAEALYAQSKYGEAAQFFSQVIADADKEKYIYAPDVYAKIINCYKITGNISEQDKYVYDLKQNYPDSAEAKSGGFVKPVFTQEIVTPEPTMAAVNAPEKTPVKTPVKTPAAEPTFQGGIFYTVQIGAYANKKFAEFDAAKLAKKKYYVFMKTEGKFTKLMVGKLKTRVEAAKLAYELSKKEKIKNFYVKQAWE